MWLACQRWIFIQVFRAQKGFKAVETSNFQGIRLNHLYRGMSDPASDDKVGGVGRPGPLIPLGWIFPTPLIFTLRQKGFCECRIPTFYGWGERPLSVGW